MVGSIVIASLLGCVLGATLIGAVSARSGGIGRNSWFGFRMPASMQSETAWRAAQRAGWRRRVLIIPVYAAALVTTLVSAANGTFDQWVIPVVSSCGIAGVLTAVWSVRAASAAARSE